MFCSAAIPRDLFYELVKRQFVIFGRGPSRCGSSPSRVCAQCAIAEPLPQWSTFDSKPGPPATFHPHVSLQLYNSKGKMHQKDSFDLDFLLFRMNSAGPACSEDESGDILYVLSITKSHENKNKTNNVFTILRGLLCIKT